MGSPESRVVSGQWLGVAGRWSGSIKADPIVHWPALERSHAPAYPHPSLPPPRLVERERDRDAAWGARFASANWGPTPKGVVEGREASGFPGGVAVLFLAVAVRGDCGLEHRAPGIEPGESVLAIGRGALADCVAAIPHEHQVDPDDVCELARLPAFGPPPAQGPPHHAQHAFLAQQRHRLRLAERLPGERH